jgi:hypothetical protein
MKRIGPEYLHVNGEYADWHKMGEFLTQTPKYLDPKLPV